MGLLGSMAAGAAAEVGGFGEKVSYDTIEAGIKEASAARMEELKSELSGGREQAHDTRTAAARQAELAVTEGGQNTRQAALLGSQEHISSEREEHQDTRTEAQIASQERIHKEAIASSEKIAKMSNQIAAGQLNLTAARDAIDNNIKNITLSNAKEVDDLRKEYVAKTTTPERRQEVHDTIQLLTGKDNDNIVPLPEKDALGNTTYSVAFNRKTGEVFPLKKAGATDAAPSQSAIDFLKQHPDSAPDFQRKYKTDPQQYLKTSTGFKRFDTSGAKGGILAQLDDADSAEQMRQYTEAASKAQQRKGM